MLCVIDIETNGLIDDLLIYKSYPYKLNESAILWCIVIYYPEINKKIILTDYQNNDNNLTINLKNLKNSLKDATVLIGHNIIKFDLLFLKLKNILNYNIFESTLYGKKIKFIDTLILSRLLNPIRIGGHSLENFGKILNNNKLDYRNLLVQLNLIKNNDPVGKEFSFFNNKMIEYCEQDVKLSYDVFKYLSKNFTENYINAYNNESILADISIKREFFGFFFEKQKALKFIEILEKKITDSKHNIESFLPLKKRNKTELKNVTLPKKQLNNNGDYTHNLLKFVNNNNCELIGNNLYFEGKEFILPYYEPLNEFIKPTIDDTDHIKMFFLYMGWQPTEWKFRNVTIDEKKNKIPIEKRIKVFEKWLEETENGLYKKERYAYHNILNIDDFTIYIKNKIHQDDKILLLLNPCIKIGVEKNICNNLLLLKDKISWVEEYSDYLTYKHRKNTIISNKNNEKGYINYLREDNRISTPSIEIGAVTNRYTHIKVANIPRVTSLFGKEIRSLFSCGKNYIQLGYDFSSLEARIMAHYCYKYTDGIKLAETMVADKPNDWHTLNSQKLNISRTSAKSFAYAIIYGASINKLAEMLNITYNKAKTLYEEFWKTNVALKELKENLKKHYYNNNKKYIKTIDNRYIHIKSEHSLLNYLFQSSGVICTKYVTTFIYKKLINLGYCVDPFESTPDISSMIEMHDECQFALKPNFITYNKFKNLDEAEKFIKNNKQKKLSTIIQNKDFYVVNNNILSETINESINDVEQLFKLNVKLDFEFSVGRNWADCH